MNYPEMGLCIAAIAGVAPFAYRLLPERTKKPLLTERDLDALDTRVKLYERLKGVEDNYAHTSKLLETLSEDFKETSTTLFSKIDRILERKP